MANPEGDTLELKMISPQSLPPAVDSDKSHPDNHPEAAADARAKIARLSELPIEASAPVKAVAHPVDPVSPAAAHQKKQTAEKRAKIKDHPAKPILTALATFLFLITLFKAPVFLSQISYLTAKPAAPDPIPAQAVTTAVNTIPTIMIPKINVNAPINFESSYDESKIQHALETGVVHYGTTPMPGQVGNSVIVGHSSNDWWEPGNYKFVFVLLDKLTIGDTLSIDYQSTRYIYKVTEAKVVTADDLSVLSPSSEPSLTLITCWPAGTNFKRWIIHATQISPATTSTGAPITPASAPANGGVLPGSAPSLLEQANNLWSSLAGAVTNQPTEVQPDAAPSSTAPTQSTGGPSLPAAK